MGWLALQGKLPTSPSLACFASKQLGRLAERLSHFVCQNIRKNAMAKLAEQGLHECPACLGSVLNPSDAQFAVKDALIQRIGERGAVLMKCKCKESFCVSV